MAIPIYSEYSNNPKSNTKRSATHQHQPEHCVNQNPREIRRNLDSGMTASVNLRLSPVRTSGDAGDPSEQLSSFLQQLQQLSLTYNVLANSLSTLRTEESTGPTHRPVTAVQELGESTLRSKRQTLPDIVTCHQTGTAVSNLHQLVELPEKYYGLVLKDIICLDVEVELACQRIGWDLRLIADNFVSMSGRKSAQTSDNTAQPKLSVPIGLQIVVTSVFIYIGYAYMLKSA